MRTSLSVYPYIASPAAAQACIWPQRTTTRSVLTDCWRSTSASPDGWGLRDASAEDARRRCDEEECSDRGFGGQFGDGVRAVAVSAPAHAHQAAKSRASDFPHCPHRPKARRHELSQRRCKTSATSKSRVLFSISAVRTGFVSSCPTSRLCIHSKNACHLRSREERAQHPTARTVFRTGRGVQFLRRRSFARTSGTTTAKRGMWLLASCVIACTCCASPKHQTASASSASARRTTEKLTAMPKSRPLTNAKGEVRELSAEDMRRFRPASDALSPALLSKLGVRGPQRAPTKERITIRLSQEVVQPFRATGDGWQTRVDAALKDWLKSHKPAKV
jgi:uncharacterized protein (DUF4415 family)